MLAPMRTTLLVAALAGCGGSRATPGQQGPVALRYVPAGELRTVDEFLAIGNRADRSRALFVEAARVLMHPRCVNCHPDGDTPHQRTGELHDPPVVRGAEDRGVPGNECATCHQDKNQDLTRVPGAPQWHLAPLAMAWVGKSASHICNQMKDPRRNGGKTLAQIVEHTAHDALVGWGWHPGHGREPVPGTQEQFGALVAAWVDTGAECPPEAQR
jgi:hypothetical protein